MKKEYVLTTANIDHISEDIDAFLKNQKQVKENKIRARLSAETALLRWLEKGYEGHKVLVDCFVRFGRPILRLMLTGASFNPLEVEEEEENYFAIIQENLACVTTFRHVHGVNILDVKLPFNAVATWQKNIFAMLLSVISWALLSFIAPDFGVVLNKAVITPTFKMLLGVLAALASFMVFFNVLNAICHMGDLTTLSQLGKGLLKQTEQANFLVAVITFIVGYFIFDVVNLNGAVDMGMFAEIYKMFLNIAPNSFVQPFVTGNTLQIMFMAVFGGILLLILSQQTPVITKAVNELNSLFMMAISRFGALTPLIVYLSFTSLLLSGKIYMLTKIWKIPAVVYILGILWSVVYTIYIALRTHTDVKKYFMENFAVFLLGYSAASTAPCVPLMNKTLEEQGVDTNYRDFALPLCQIICPCGIIISMGTVAMGLAEMAGLKLPLSTFLIILFSVFLLAQTVPPVTGASISVMILILAQINVPQDFVALFVSIDYFLNMMRVGASKSSAMNSVYSCAYDEGKIE